MHGPPTNPKTIEWNLGFARDEVIGGLEKLLTQGGYEYTRTEIDAEVHFQATVSPGSIALKVQPLLASTSPFNVHIFFHRTLLLMAFTDVKTQEEESFMRRLTLTFLRAGG